MVRHHRYNEKKRRLIRNIRFWVAEIILLIILAFLFVFFCFQIAVVHGNAMNPDLKNRDIVVVNKLKYKLQDPKRLDVVMVTLDDDKNERYIFRRIIGLPGENIQITNGKLYINGQERNFLGKDTIANGGRASTGITLGKDEYFVIGDNFYSSEDSRMESIGNIPRKKIVGKVVSFSSE